MVLPNFAPRIDRIHVVISIVKHANNIFIFRNANVIPTANASMLVAIANIDISFSAKYMLEALKTLKDEDILILLNNIQYYLIMP